MLNHNIRLPPIKDILANDYQKPKLPLPQTSHFNLSAGNRINVMDTPLNRSQFPLPPTTVQHPVAPAAAAPQAPSYYYQPLPVHRASSAEDINSSTSSSPPHMSQPSSPATNQLHHQQNLSAKEKRKTRNNLPKETTYILLKWLNDHLNHPYPNSFEKSQLMMSTGLNQQQLSNWFINARRRKIKILKEQQRLSV